MTERKEKRREEIYVHEAECGGSCSSPFLRVRNWRRRTARQGVGARVCGNVHQRRRFRDAAVDLEEAKIIIEGDTATVYPVGLEFAMELMSLEFTLTKEDGVWRLNYQD